MEGILLYLDLVVESHGTMHSVIDTTCDENSECERAGKKGTSTVIGVQQLSRGAAGWRWKDWGGL